MITSKSKLTCKGTNEQLIFDSTVNDYSNDTVDSALQSNISMA